MTIRQHPRPWDCPVVHYETATGLILSPAGDGTRAQAGGYSIPRAVISIEGCWSNIDVFISVPDAWVTEEVRLELWSIGPAGKALLQTAFCHLAGLQSSSGFSAGIILSARGAAADGFEVRAATPTTVENGQIQLRVWGDQSSPDFVGNMAGTRLPDFRMPSRAAHLLAYNDTEELPWQPLIVDPATGALVVTGASGGTTTVIGNDTPSDAYANPTDAVGTWSLTGAYNRVAGTWGRVDRGDLTSAAAIANASAGAGMRSQAFMYGQKLNTVGLAEWMPIGVQNNGTLLVGLLGDQANVDNVNLSGTAYELTGGPAQHRAQGGNWYLTRGGYIELIPAAALPAILNQLPAAVYRGADPSPALGDAIVNSASFRGGLHVTQLPTSPGDTYELPSRITAPADLVVEPGGLGTPVIVFSVTADNESGGRLFVQLHNKSTAVAPGDVPVWQWALANQERFALGEEAFTVQGLFFSNGCQLAWSTTSWTYTAPGAAAGCNSHIRYTT